MLTARLGAACPPSLRIPLARYLAGEISGELLLMHLVLGLDADAAPSFTFGKEFLRIVVRAAAGQNGDLVPTLDQGQGQIGQVLRGGGNVGVEGLVEEEECQNRRKDLLPDVWLYEVVELELEGGAGVFGAIVAPEGDFNGTLAGVATALDYWSKAIAISQAILAERPTWRAVFPETVIYAYR